MKVLANPSLEPRSEETMTDREEFLYPYHNYQGQFTPKHLVFNANLQEFAKRTSYICSLETGGKLSPEAAYQKLAALWEVLTRSKEQLRIEDSAPDEPQIYILKAAPGLALPSS